MAQMGVTEMIYGQLTDAMRLPESGVVERDRFIHPRVEPEVAFILRRPLPGTLELDEVRDSVAAICPAIEVIDSRYRNFRFSLTDVVADNSSAAAFVLGAPVPAETAIGDLSVTLAINDFVQAKGSTSAILGDPWLSLLKAAQFAARDGIVLGEGDIVLAGAATKALPANSGDQVKVEIAGMEPLRLTFS
jgi:2-oxo-3-hexenedioate decarboxylase